MKKITILFVLTTSMVFLLPYILTGQDIIKQSRDLPAFNKIEAGGAFEVYLFQGEPQRVEVEAAAEHIDKIVTKVNDGTLTFEAKGLRNFKELNVYVTVPSIEMISASGASYVVGKTPIKGDMLNLFGSGAADIRLEVDLSTLRLELSGASNASIKGRADNFSTELSGAAELKAAELETLKSDLDVSGAANAKVSGKGDVTGNVSGAGDISYVTPPDSKVVNKKEVVIISNDDNDTTIVSIPGARVEVIEGNDTIKVTVGDRMIIVDDDGNVRFERNRKMKFNGHWAGFDIGVNGYVNPDFNMNFPQEYEYLDLRMEKSIAININFFEQNISLSKNQQWGMLTGLGLGFNDYRFSRPTRLSSDSSFLVGYLDNNISIRKSKLSAMYLTLPLIFEYQTNRWMKKNSFHLGLGMVMSTRLSSHTKKYYNELNKEFDVTLYNQETDRYETVYTSVSPDSPKTHSYGDWYLQPFKFDATVRIGWGWINLWANFGVNTLFRKDRGPELYPWSAGITLLNF